MGNDVSLQEVIESAIKDTAWRGLRKYQKVVAEEVLRTYESGGGAVIAVLPTGYGKTLIPVILAARLVSDGVVERVIHTYPATSMIEHLLIKGNSEVRALRRAWVKHFRLNSGLERLLLGARHMFRHDSTLLTNPYVITTLDTLAAHYLKTAFAKSIKGSGRGVYSEFSAGVVHSSLLVFDEAHMYPVITEQSLIPEPAPILGKAFNVMAYIMGMHAAAGGTSLLMTATMPEPLLEGINEVLNRYGVTPKIVTYDADPEFEEVTSSSRELKLEGLEEASNRAELINKVVRDVKALARQGKTVLCVMNTVRDAIKVYKEVKDGVEYAVLAHSRFTIKDRERIVKEIEDVAKKPGSVIVSTQVVEASIDISVNALITDAAPLDSVVQRMGRVCRAGHVCEGRSCKGIIKVYYVGSELGKNDAYGPYDSRLVSESLKSLSKVREGELSKFIINPRELISEAYINAYSFRFQPFRSLLDFLEQLTVRTSPAVIEGWAVDEFGGFIRNEDLGVIALVSDDSLREYIRKGIEDALKVEILNAVGSNLVKVRLSNRIIKEIINLLISNGFNKAVISWVGIKDVSLQAIDLGSREGSVSNEAVRIIKRVIRSGAYLLVPEDFYDREVGLTLGVM